MSWGYHQWRPYVPVAQRRANAAKQLAKLAKKGGQAAAPVLTNGRKIASTFWGRAWCENLEAYSDFANRLPRGRTYVRNGSVVDLQVSPGKIEARVCGSELYRIQIKIKPLPPAVWESIQTECAGQIDSLLELLQGKLSTAVMQIVTRLNGGLFPAPKEIDLDCSCPDWADLCKHVAASLYGVGARLDTNPELLFTLRGVNAADLISKSAASQAIRSTATPTTGAPAMSDSEMADVFGIDLETGPVTAQDSKIASAPSSPPADQPAVTVPVPKQRRPRAKPKRTKKNSAPAKARTKAKRKPRSVKI